MSNKSNQDYFSLVLASTVHDMKNSLAMLGQSLDHILEKQKKITNDENTNKEIGIVQYESNRVNNSLMQLLSLYKLENGQLPFNPNYHNMYEFIEEQTIVLSQLLEAKDIICDIEVDESIDGFFDQNLLAIVIENIFGNAIRYTKSKITISCKMEDYLVIQINDDGHGYPEAMLNLQENYMHGINQSTGSTGLGLFFADQIASIHKNKSKKGYIALSNGGALNGGLFEIYIP
ncbi:MAG: sensor histidine kinase [Kangiellaceae bacterium]